MKQRTSRVRAALVIVIILVSATAAGGQAQSAGLRSIAEPAHVSVVGVDYAFVQLPTSLPAGPTLFSFENRGAKRHEMSIALLVANYL